MNTRIAFTKINHEYFNCERLFNIIHETMHKNITENLIFKLNLFDTIITR